VDDEAQTLVWSDFSKSSCFEDDCFLAFIYYVFILLMSTTD